MQFRVIVVTDQPTNKHTGAIIIHRAAALLACSVITRVNVIKNGIKLDGTRQNASLTWTTNHKTRSDWIPGHTAAAQHDGFCSLIC